MRKECEMCIHLPVCKDELKNNETELCPYYEIEKPEEDHSSKCQMQTRVSLPSDDQINFVAGEESQKDWNDLRYKEVYEEGFIDGARWMLRRAKGN